MSEREKLREAERLIFEVIETWGQQPEWSGTPVDIGMLLIAKMILNDGVGIGLTDEQAKALLQARMEAKLLAAIHAAEEREAR